MRRGGAAWVLCSSSSRTCQHTNECQIKKTLMDALKDFCDIGIWVECGHWWEAEIAIHKSGGTILANWYLVSPCAIRQRRLWGLLRLSLAYEWHEKICVKLQDLEALQHAFSKLERELELNKQQAMGKRWMTGRLWLEQSARRESERHQQLLPDPRFWNKRLLDSTVKMFGKTENDGHTPGHPNIIFSCPSKRHPFEGAFFRWKRAARVQPLARPASRLQKSRRRSGTWLPSEPWTKLGEKKAAIQVEAERFLLKKENPTT